MTTFAPAPLPNAASVAARAAEGLTRDSTVSAIVWSVVEAVAVAQGEDAEWAQALATMIANKVVEVTGRED